MFSKSRATEPEAAGVSSPSPRGRDAAGGRGTTFSIIGADVTVTGNLQASVDLHIDGRIEGDVRCASLVQGGSSVVAGAIIAETARLAGTVEGSIEATDLVIEASARIIGDVTYENIRIEQGAHVEGSFRHRNSVAAIHAHPIVMPAEAEPLQLTGGKAA